MSKSIINCYCYCLFNFPPSFHLTVVCFCSIGLSLLIQRFHRVLWVLKLLLSPGLGSWQLEFKSLIIVIVGFFFNFEFLFVTWPGVQITDVGRSLYIGSFCPAMKLRRELLVFRSLQVCLFFYGCFQGVLWTSSSWPYRREEDTSK